MAKEQKKPKHLDELLDQMRGEHTKDLDASFKAWDAFTKDENQLNIYNNILAPAQDNMYQVLVSELDKAFDKKDETKLEKEEHHKKVKKAVAKALRAYFEKTEPHLVKAMDDIGMEEEDQYEHLASQYDAKIGANPRSKENPGIRAIVESLSKGKKTVGHVKKGIYDIKNTAVAGAMENIIELHKQHHLGKYKPTQIAAYLKPKVEKEGYTIKDKLGYAQMDLDNLLGLRNSIVEKKIHPYLGKKEDKK